MTLDAFVATNGPVIVHWPSDLDGGQRSALAALFRRVPYLGRAESPVSVDVLPNEVEVPPPNCEPSDGISRRDTEIVRVLSPAPGVKREDLERTSAEIQDEGWVDPPGTRWVFYRRPPNSLSGRPSSPGPKRRSVPSPHVARLALGGTVLPLITDCIRVAQKMRAAAMASHGTYSRNLCGKTEDGRQLDDPAEQHRHAHFLPYAADSRRDNRITHVIVYCPNGMTDSERRALLRIRFLRQDDNRPDLEVVCDGFGSTADFAGLNLFSAGSREWLSCTPLLLPRHPKRNGRHAFPEQIGAELVARGLPAPAEATTMERVRGRYRPVEFELRRDPFDSWPSTPALSVHLKFDTPITGPILLGRHSHYGLEQFLAVA